MSCSVTIQSVTATAQGAGSTLHVTVVASGCKCLQLTARCSSTLTSQIYPLTGAASETVIEDITVPCACGTDVHITASCVDTTTHQPLPGCTSDTYHGPINCGDPCCIQPQINYVTGACNANKEQAVTFTTVWNVPTTLPASCYPIVGQLNFGNGPSVGQIQYIAAPGTYSFSDTYLYPAASTTTYQVQFVYSHPTCPSVPLSITVGPCAPADCCPKITNVTIQPGACQSDCTRAVTIKTSFSPPAAGCLAEALQWHFYDKNGNPITNVNSNAFLTSGASPNVQSFIFDPALAPITAKLSGLQYPNCVDAVVTINLAPCDGPPACPTIHSFTANVGGCENIGGKCLRRVDFTLDADIFAGCGSSAGTTIEIDFGDGDQEQFQFTTSGHCTVTSSHHYSGGDYDVTLTVLNPSMCLGQVIKLHVPPCAPKDCNLDAPCPPLPKPPAWCLCKLCYIFSHKPGKGWCKAWIFGIAVWVGLVIVAAFMGWTQFVTPAQGHPWTWALIMQNIGAAVSLIGSAGLVLWYSHKCGYCCLACAVLLGMIMAIIAIVIIVISTTVTPPATIWTLFSWWGGAFALFGAFLVWSLAEHFCKTDEEAHLNSDTWCKTDRSRAARSCAAIRLDWSPSSCTGPGQPGQILPRGAACRPPSFCCGRQALPEGAGAMRAPPLSNRDFVLI